MELAELCKELNNWFDLRRHFGTFTIEDGKIKDVENLGLLENQYFRIVGSVFNDGVFKNPKEDFQDETFDGAIWAMAIPPDIIALADRMTAWEEEYGGAVKSPYSSESFGGYSYTKGSGNASKGAENGASGVLGAFYDELNRWRKV